MMAEIPSCTSWITAAAPRRSWKTPRRSNELRFNLVAVVGMKKHHNSMVPGRERCLATVRHHETGMGTPMVPTSRQSSFYLESSFIL